MARHKNNTYLENIQTLGTYCLARSQPLVAFERVRDRSAIQIFEKRDDPTEEQSVFCMMAGVFGFAKFDTIYPVAPSEQEIERAHRDLESHFADAVRKGDLYAANRLAVLHALSSYSNDASKENKLALATAVGTLQNALGAQNPAKLFFGQKRVDQYLGEQARGNGFAR